jgi:hypothetical protein
MVGQMKPSLILTMNSQLMPCSRGWRSSGRSFAKGGAHSFVAPADGSGASGVSNRAVMMGALLLFMRLLENCFGRLPRADVFRSVQGNLFP